MVTPEDSARKSFFIYWVILLVFTASFLVVSQLVNPANSIIVRDFYYSVTGVVTVAVLAAAALKSNGEDRRIWALIAAAGIGWSFGDIIMRVYESTGASGAQRVLSLPDVFYLMAYISLAFAVVYMARLTRDKKHRMDWARFYPLALVIEVIVVSFALALYLPNGLAEVFAGESGLSVAKIVNYLYPALDLGIVAGLLLILFTHRIPFRKTWHEVLIFGLSMFTVADISYSLFKPTGIYDPANLPTQIIIAIWLLSYGLLIMAGIYKLNEA